MNIPDDWVKWMVGVFSSLWLLSLTGMGKLCYWMGKKDGKEECDNTYLSNGVRYNKKFKVRTKNTTYNSDFKK